MKKLLIYPALLLLGAFAGCNDADDVETTDTTTTTTSVVTDTAPVTPPPVQPGPPITGKDSIFVMEAASGGLMEVELGRLAQEKAVNDRVKQYAQMMVNDHGRANDELKSLIANRNFMLPDTMMKKHKADVEKMQKLEGRSFDRQYMQMMVKDHTADVSKFTTTSKSATDSALKDWAGRTLPVLQMHLDSAKAINKMKL